MKKVLIAIDYNPCATKVAETGYDYARAMNAEICIVHAIADIAYYTREYSPIMGFKGFSNDGSFRDIDEQEKEANIFLTAVVHHLGDKRIKTKVLDGKTAETILEYAELWKADLIVMGAQSHNSFEKVLMGDVAVNVLKHSPMAVLIVPTDKQEQDMVSEKEEIHLYI